MIQTPFRRNSPIELLLPRKWWLRRVEFKVDNLPTKIAIILLTVLSIVLIFSVLMLALNNIYLHNTNASKALKISELKRSAVYDSHVNKKAFSLLDKAGCL